MIEALYVPKSYGTYSDTCLMLGLACLAEYALGATGQKQGMQLIDEGTCYRIKFNKPIDLEKIESIPYFDLFPIVVGAKTQTDKIPKEVHCFKTVENSEARRLYHDWKFKTKGKEKWRENAPDPPDSRTQNGIALMSLKCNDAHFRFWEKAWNIKNYFGDLVSTILKVFSDHHILSHNSAVETIAKEFKTKTRTKLPDKDSAVKIYMPSSIEGVNRVLADGTSTQPQKDAWLNLWLIAKGLFDFALSESVKLKSDPKDKTYDWRVVVLEPKNISLSNYRSILSDLKRLNPPARSYGIARFDAELVLRFSQEMLNLSCQTSRKPKLVSNFRGGHFGLKGKVYGLKDVFSLGLPDWIKVRPEESKKAIAYHKVLEEHLSVIQSLDQKETEMLMAYRDFITGINFNLFFPFQVQYANYCVKKIAKDEYVKLFSCKNLDTMIMSSKKELKKIVTNKGFAQIARAINYATVRSGQILVKKGEAGTPYPKKDFEFKRFYGLAQRLGSRTSSRDDFVNELSAFLTEYKSEYTRLESKLGQGEKMLLSNVKASHIDDFVRLIDDWNNISLVANLLLAYGHSYWDRETE